MEGTYEQPDDIVDALISSAEFVAAIRVPKAVLILDEPPRFVVLIRWVTTKPTLQYATDTQCSFQNTRKEPTSYANS